MNPMFYFFLALTAVLATTVRAAGGEPVLDINGDIITRGGYYVLPVYRGRGGGLTLYSNSDRRCPLDIVQTRSEVDDGIAVKFSNWRSRVAFVPESSNLNIKMDVAGTTCVQSTYWTVDEFLQVTAGPKPDEYEEDATKSFFQIKRVENEDAYKFVFCPKNCIDVGIYIEKSGVRRLSLSSTPFLVQFKKAHSYDSSKTMPIISV